jgi:hypothetical protein
MFLAICVLGGLVFWPTPTEAALITIEIEAVVDFVEDDGNYLEGKIKPGDIISGFYVYESTTPDSSPLDPVQGNYWNYAPPAGIALTVDGFNFMTDPFNIEFRVVIRNNTPSGNDIYGVESFNNLPLSNGTLVGGILWSMRDGTGSALSSDALPTTAPALDDWQDNILNFGGGTRASGYGIMGHVTSAIPEPATIVLLGLGGLLFGRRR